MPPGLPSHRPRSGRPVLLEEIERRRTVTDLLMGQGGLVHHIELIVTAPKRPQIQGERPAVLTTRAVVPGQRKGQRLDDQARTEANGRLYGGRLRQIRLRCR